MFMQFFCFPFASCEPFAYSFHIIHIQADNRSNAKVNAFQNLAIF